MSNNPFSNLDEKETLITGDLSILSSSYIPDFFPHREQQIDYMVRTLSPIMKQGKASNLVLYGKSGTGKTSVTKYVAQMLVEATKSGVTVVYINCQIFDSPYSILVSMVNSINQGKNEPIPSMGWPLDRIYSEFLTRMSETNKYVLVVLDEIDKLIQKNGGDSLYVILKTADEEVGSRISIVGITNYTSFVDNLDARVRSRLNQESIIFQPYNAPQLRDILIERLKGMGGSDSIEESAISLCAAIGAREHGDARKAIDLLRIAIEISVRDGKRRTTESEVYLARNKFETDVVKESVRSLPLHSKILLLSVILTQKSAERPVYTGEVFENYKRICEELSIQNLGLRRISEVLSDLDDVGLIVSITKSLGRGGRTRFIRIPDHAQSIESYLLEDEQLSTFKGTRLTKQQRLKEVFDGRDVPFDDIFSARENE